MIKPEDIPDEAVMAFTEEYRFGDGDWRRKGLAAAINAWPDIARCGGPGICMMTCPAIILPTKENTDD